MPLEICPSWGPGIRADSLRSTALEQSQDYSEHCTLLAWAIDARLCPPSSFICSSTLLAQTVLPCLHPCFHFFHQVMLLGDFSWKAGWKCLHVSVGTYMMGYGCLAAALILLYVLPKRAQAAASKWLCSRVHCCMYRIYWSSVSWILSSSMTRFWRKLLK